MTLPIRFLGARCRCAVAHGKADCYACKGDGCFDCVAWKEHQTKWERFRRAVDLKSLLLPALFAIPFFLFTYLSLPEFIKTLPVQQQQNFNTWLPVIPWLLAGVFVFGAILTYLCYRQSQEV